MRGNGCIFFTSSLFTNSPANTFQTVPVPPAYSSAQIQTEYVGPRHMRVPEAASPPTCPPPHRVLSREELDLNPPRAAVVLWLCRSGENACFKCASLPVACSFCLPEPPLSVPPSPRRPRLSPLLRSA